MIQTYLKRMPELAISGAMILIMLLFSLIFNLPLIYPSGERAAFVGIHYIYPLIGVGLLGILKFFVGNRAIASRFLIALPRSEARSVGKEGKSTCRSRWSPYH